jgi:hypothetical protein
MRRKIMRAAVCTLCLLVAVVLPAGQSDRSLLVPSEIVEQIQVLLSDQAATYELDTDKNRAVFERIENWVKTRMELDPRQMTRDKQGDWFCFKELKQVNTPIALDGERALGLEPSPFHVFYVEEPQRRTFRKEIWEPTATALSDGELRSLAGGFIRDHRFVEETGSDKMANCQILSWKQRAVNEDELTGDSTTVLQRVTFVRTFQGMEVVNSRQIVDIHPETRELIAYKSLEWTPINEESGTLASTISIDEVIRQIREAFSDEPDAVVDHVKRAWIQTTGRLIPVLEIRKVFDGKTNGASPHNTILVGLVEEMPLEDNLVAVDRPGKAKRGQD